jgi:hypothetical protein
MRTELSSTKSAVADLTTKLNGKIFNEKLLFFLNEKNDRIFFQQPERVK